MASSQGRARAEKRVQKSFAFGSSTPRDLSHISALPPPLRLVNAKPKEQLTQNGTSNAHEHDVIYYMRKARSVTPSNSERGKRAVRAWAFGSSTPREFSHLRNVPPELRVYDAKVSSSTYEMRSVTSPSIADKAAKPATTIKTPRTARPATTQKQTKSVDEADEVSSEPDIDRRQDFESAVKGLSRHVQRNQVAAGKPPKPETRMRKGSKPKVKTAATPRAEEEKQAKEDVSEKDDNAVELPTPTEPEKSVAAINEGATGEGIQKAVAAAPTVKPQQDSTAVVVPNNHPINATAEEAHPSPPTSQRSTKDDGAGLDALKNHAETIVEPSPAQMIVSSSEDTRVSVQQPVVQQANTVANTNNTFEP